jgi:hypothetical protein
VAVKDSENLIGYWVQAQQVKQLKEYSQKLTLPPQDRGAEQFV